MAEIPYKPVPSVQPAETGLPHISEQVPHVEISNAVSKALEIVGHGTGVLGEAYKEVGDAYGKLGKNFEGAGDELFTRAVALQQVELNRNVDKAELALIQQNGDLMESAIANPNLGKEGMRSAVKQSMDNRTAGRESLRTQWEREQFDKRTMNIITSDSRRLASRVANTEQSDTIKISEAMIKTLKEKLADPKLDPESPYARELQQRLRDQTINTWAPASGVHPGPRLQEKLQDDQNDIKYSQILQTADGSLDRAIEMFNRSADSKNTREYISDPQKRQALYNQLTEKAKDIIPMVAAHEATKDPKVTEEEAGARAGNLGTERARNLGLSGDAQIAIRNSSETRAISQVRQMDSATNFTNGRNQSNISKFIMGDNPNKKHINNIAELTKEQQAQIQAMPFDMQQSIKRLLEKPPEDVPVTVENKNGYHRIINALVGLGTPEERNRALSINPYDPAMEMPEKFRDAIWREQTDQRAAGKKAIENPDVVGAFEVGSSRGLIPKELKDKNSDAYKEWSGMVTVAIREEVARKKGHLNKDEQAEVVKGVTHNYFEAGGKALYQMGVEKGQLEEARKIAPNASEDQLKDMVRRWMYINRLKIIEQEKVQFERRGKDPIPQKPTKPLPTGRDIIFDPGAM